MNDSLNGRPNAAAILDSLGAEQQLREMHQETGDGWEVPVPLTGAPPAPPFPTEVFPGWVADMVTGVARFTQTDPGMAGTLALAVLSACCGGRLEVEVVPGWREPTNIFSAVVADPGERKSPTYSAMTRPLRSAERTLADQIEPQIAEATALRDISNRAAERAKSAAANADAAAKDERTSEAVAAVLAAEAITVPTLPRLLADDATPEALKTLMANNGGRMALISDEGGIFDTLAGRYSGTPDLDPYLKGHAGQPMSSDRRTREGDQVEKPALTVGVMIQPSVLRKFGADETLTGRGLVARFLFTLPTSMAGWRETDPDPVPDNVTVTYTRHIHNLAATLAEWEDPAIVPLTPEARLVRSAQAADIEIKLRPDGALRDMREWANKLSGATIRLAGLLHMAHHPSDGWRLPISAETMTDATRLAEFFVAHYRAAVHTITVDKHTKHVRHVLNVLTEKSMHTFTRRELHRRVPRQLPRAEDVTGVLTTLSQLGWIRSVPGSSGYELHPQAAEHLKNAETVATHVDGTFSAAMLGGDDE